MSPNNTTSGEGIINATRGLPPFVLEVIMEPTWVLIIRLTVECLIALAGVFGNLVVCFAITKLRTLNVSLTNTYIRNVAVADLAALLISFPLVVVRERFPYWPLGEFVCRYIFPWIDIFYGVSVWTVAAIAIDRHYILAANVPRLVHRSLDIPRIICAAIWLLSFLVISLPLVLVFEYREFPNKKPKCVAIWGKGTYELQIAYNIAVSLVTYVLPLSVILVTFFTIKRKLYKCESFHLEMAESSFSIGSFSDSQISLAKSRTKRLKTIMTPAVVVIFSITVLPLNLLRVVPRFLPVARSLVYLKYSNVIYNVCIFLFICNAACNPLMYSFASKRFRQSFRQLLIWS